MVLPLTALSGVSIKGWVLCMFTALRFAGIARCLSQASYFQWTAFDFDFREYHLAQLEVHEQDNSRVKLFPSSCNL